MRENFGLELQNGPSLTYMLDLIAMQMSRVNHKKGYMTFFVEWFLQVLFGYTFSHLQT